MRKITVFILALTLLISIAAPVCADNIPLLISPSPAGLTISSPEEFLSFAESCRLDSYSQGLTVTLEADIDLSGSEFTPIPIFSGTFDGKGHAISGLSLTADGSVQGLFRFLTATAVVQDLVVKGDIHPGGSRSQVGAIAGQNEGQILRCSFEGQLSGGDQVGGIVGINTVTGVIKDCLVSGTVHGDHFVGGIAGENAGVIRGCSNQALINTTPQQNDISISDITMDSLTNAEAANTVTDIGGIAGISSGVIRECKNNGDIGYPHMGYNIGGIAGTQSGYIADCENRGNIQGRKEVGGIVGQMEPASIIEYSEDTLQLLQGQLDDLSGLVNRASGNAQAGADQINSQIGLLQEQTQAARDAVDVLFPDQEDPEVPDPDTILAAQNALSDALDAMPVTLRSIATAAQTTVNILSSDLGAISAQVNAMGNTVNKASENLGGSLRDISDQDTPEQLTGKVEGCLNYGDILADLNAGGIAGAAAMENDLDVLEDWDQQGEQSLNFESQLRAVLLHCENHGTVTGKKQNVGGIVGWQSLGLVKSCTNMGNIYGEEANYVGGIAGLSTGYVRSNYAKCQIQSSTYAGGIAGSGAIVTDCISMVQLLGGSEKLGAILGEATQSSVQSEEPAIAGNLYLALPKDIGAIDGISYSGLAEGMALEDFLAVEALPEVFHHISVYFLFEDGTQERIDVLTGSSLSADNIPVIPEKNGFTAQWNGIEAADLSNMVFDMRFDAVYTPYRTTIQSTQTRDNGLPILLAEGAYIESSALSVTEADAAPRLEGKDTLLEAWLLHIPEGTDTARFLLPSDADADRLKLLALNADGVWEELSFTQRESYLVFSAAPGEMQLALVQKQDYAVWLLAGAGIAVMLCTAAVFVLRKNSKRPKTKV